jgi:hypothetical protein
LVQHQHLTVLAEADLEALVHLHRRLQLALCLVLQVLQQAVLVEDAELLEQSLQ